MDALHTCVCTGLGACVMVEDPTTTTWHLMATPAHLSAVTAGLLQTGVRERSLQEALMQLQGVVDMPTEPLDVSFLVRCVTLTVDNRPGFHVLEWCVDHRVAAQA